MRAILLVLLLALAAGCVRRTSQDADLARLRDDAARFERDVTQTEGRAHRLSARWRDVENAYEAAAVEYSSARRAYEHAAQAGAVAGAAYEQASARWQEAAKWWALYQRLVFVAAYIDASNLTAAQNAARPSSLSCEHVSTATFRRVLTAAGQDLTGMDIDHIVPRSLGGADHPSNYRVIGSSLNRSMGAQWDRAKCLSAGAQCADAVAVSRQCGSYAGVLP